jgi:hypothetical protein
MDSLTIEQLDDVARVPFEPADAAERAACAAKRTMYDHFRPLAIAEMARAGGALESRKVVELWLFFLECTRIRQYFEASSRIRADVDAACALGERTRAWALAARAEDVTALPVPFLMAEQLLLGGARLRAWHAQRDVCIHSADPVDWLRANGGSTLLPHAELPADLQELSRAVRAVYAHKTDPLLRL